MALVVDKLNICNTDGMTITWGNEAHKETLVPVLLWSTKMPNREAWD
jgi:hypothetical protein